MASFGKLATGWRVQVAIKGVRESKVFATKAEAAAWASKRETEIREGAATGIQRHRTVDEAFRRYEKEVSSTKRGHRQEALRLAAIGRTEIDGVALKEMRLVEVTSDVLGKWRDHRLKVDRVKGSSINRDLNLLSHVFSSAMKEWKWIAKSPTTDVRRPQDPAPRERLYTEDEINRLCLTCGFDLNTPERADTGYKRVAVAFLFAIETAMRAGEIIGLTSADISGRTARLRAEATKNGTKRDVPLSKKALELLALLPEVPEEGQPLFQMTAATLDALFRKARERAGVEGTTFHDTRHLAITRLAKKFPNVLDLARMTGHKDLRKLQIYYNETAEKMADLLD
jgi:integrase